MDLFIIVPSLLARRRIAYIKKVTTGLHRLYIFSHDQGAPVDNRILAIALFKLLYPHRPQEPLVRWLGYHQHLDTAQLGSLQFLCLLESQRPSNLHVTDNDLLLATAQKTATLILRSLSISCSFLRLLNCIFQPLHQNLLLKLVRSHPSPVILDQQLPMHFPPQSMCKMRSLKMRSRLFDIPFPSFVLSILHDQYYKPLPMALLEWRNSRKVGHTHQSFLEVQESHIHKVFYSWITTCIDLSLLLDIFRLPFLSRLPHALYSSFILRHIV